MNATQFIQMADLRIAVEETAAPDDARVTDLLHLAILIYRPSHGEVFMNAVVRYGDENPTQLLFASLQALHEIAIQRPDVYWSKSVYGDRLPMDEEVIERGRKHIRELQKIIPDLWDVWLCDVRW